MKKRCPVRVGEFFYDTVGRAMKVIVITPSLVTTVTCCEKGLRTLVYERDRFDQAARDGFYRKSPSAKKKWIKVFNADLKKAVAEQKKLLGWYGA